MQQMVKPFQKNRLTKLQYQMIKSRQVIRQRIQFAVKKCRLLTLTAF